MEKLDIQSQSEESATHESLANLHNEVAHEAHMQQARDFMQHCEVAPPINIKSITEKILKKGLDAHPELQKPLLGKELMAFQKELYTKQPELWQFMTFDVGIHSFSCDHYDDLQPTEKIKLMAAHGAIYDMLPLSIGLKNKQGTYDLAKLKSRYMAKLESVTQDLTSTFRFDQRKNLGNTLSTLQKDYGLTVAEAQAFKQYLDAVEREYKKTQPMEANMGRFVAGVVTGLLISGLGLYIYDRITNPRGMAENNMGEINLGDPSLLAKLVTAEQPFTVNGTRTESLYDTTNETGLARIAQDIINSAQSRTVTMSLDGKVGVEYDFDTKNGAVFTYDPKTKFINVQLPHPTFKIRDQKATILARNSELIEIGKFNNTEQNLLNELNEKALQKVETQQHLIDMSMKKASEVIYTMYGPILRHFKQDVIGIQVTVAGQAPQKFLP